MNIDKKRIEIASNLSSIQNTNGQPYISIDWIKKHILKITREDEIKIKREERIRKLNEINTRNDQ